MSLQVGVFTSASFLLLEVGVLLPRVPPSQVNSRVDYTNCYTQRDTEITHNPPVASDLLSSTSPANPRLGQSMTTSCLPEPLPAAFTQGTLCSDLSK